MSRPKASLIGQYWVSAVVSSTAAVRNRPTFAHFGIGINAAAAAVIPATPTRTLCSSRPTLHFIAISETALVRLLVPWFRL